jgi:thioredoxin-related protein
MTFEVVQKAMKKKPTKVFVDIYTHWCGPCKMLSNTTLKDPVIVNYLNEHYYSIKFNAEQAEAIEFKGQVFENPNYDPNRKGRNGTHQLTYEIGRTERGVVYPTTVYMDESFNVLTPVAGAIQAPTMYSIITWFGTNRYQEMTYEEYTATEESQ